MNNPLKKIYLDSVGSTNTWVKEHASELDPTLLYWICAEEQTQGRGQKGRSWSSVKGKDLIGTLHFTLPDDREDLAWVTQVMALSVLALLEHYGLKGTIKWPNDVFVNCKKIAGILCETTVLHGSRRTSLALGVGLNVNSTEEMLQSVGTAATSLYEACKRTFILSEVEKVLLEAVSSRLILFEEKGFSPFELEFRKRLKIFQ